MANPPLLTTLAPFHPRFVHFPIALCLVGAFFIAAGLIRGRERWVGYGQISLLLGWLGVMAAVVTGLIDQSGAPDDAAIRAIINQHITAGIALVMAVGLALYWPLRNKRLFSAGNTRWGFVALLVIIVALVALEGWLGGKLVFQYGVGVK
jgi:uncharacterized membrane protein